MPDYRAYFADTQGRILAEEFVEAADDACAIVAVRRLVQPGLTTLAEPIGGLEIWLGSGPRSASRVPNFEQHQARAASAAGSSRCTRTQSPK